MDAGELMELGPVLPVVVLDDADHAVPLAKALLAGGIRTMELTLRTPTALAGIERIAAEVPEIVVGAGTIVEPAQAARAVAAGVRFLVSPGSPPPLVDAMLAHGVPVLPGVATVTEVLALLARGMTEMKFFPAEASGGAAFLRALAGPVGAVLPDGRGQRGQPGRLPRTVHSALCRRKPAHPRPARRERRLAALTRLAALVTA